MSLDKAIEHGKEKRKPYYGAQAIDCTCRPHGSCEWCRSNRLYQQLKMEEASRQALEEMEGYMIKVDESLLNQYIFSHIDMLKYEKGICDDFIYIVIGIDVANQLIDKYKLIYPSSIEERPKYMGYPVEIDRRVPMRVSVCVEYPIPVYTEF